MDSRFELRHHPKASDDFKKSLTYFTELDEDLGGLFQNDFQTGLRAIATGKQKGQLLLRGSLIRWVKLARFSHKIFFEPDGPDQLLVLGLISGRRHPTRIRLMLSRRSRSS